jgi:hypothetical protein
VADIHYDLFSVDDHIVEPADVWSSRVPVKFRETAPHVVEEDGREYWCYEDQRTLTMGLNGVAGKPREQWGLEPTRFADMIPGCYDPRFKRHNYWAKVSDTPAPRMEGITDAKTTLHAGDPCPEMHIGTNMLERCGLPLDANVRCPAGHRSVLAGV